MKRLRTRFGLVLGSVLLVATLLPVLVLYLLSKSGWVEATYITETRDAREQEALLWVLLANDLPGLPSLPQVPLADDDRRDLLLWLASKDPQTGQPRVPILFDPETGRVSGVAGNNLERIVLTSQIFKFRVDLPAWIVIGSFPVFGLLMGFVLSLVLSRSVTRPVSQLAEAAHAIGRRDLGYRVRAGGGQELQELAQSFNRMAEQLEHTETARRNLMADVAHELRTPLAVLDGNLRALLDGVHAISEDEIALLYEQTRHLNHLVDDLRELSLAEADHLSLNRREVDLARLVKESAAHFDFVAQEQGIDLRMQVEGALIHPALDENRVRQVLHNLLSNAFRHTRKGGSILISAKWLLDETAVEIAVSDNGAGISAEELPHIFDRFYRTDETVRRDQGGTGLGLTIGKAIVEALGGTIRAESSGKDQGSTFTIRFP